MATTAATLPARARAPLASRWRDSAASRPPDAVRAPSARLRLPGRASYLVRRAPCRDARQSPRAPGAIAEPEVAETDAEPSSSLDSDAGASASPDGSEGCGGGRGGGNRAASGAAGGGEGGESRL